MLIRYYFIPFTSHLIFLIVLYSHSIRFSNIWLHSYNDITTLLNVDVVAKVKLRWKKLSVLSTVSYNKEKAGKCCIDIYIGKYSLTYSDKRKILIQL